MSVFYHTKVIWLLSIAAMIIARPAQTACTLGPGSQFVLWDETKSKGISWGTKSTLN